MDEFKEVCRQSCEDWANSFDDSQEYAFSSAFESEMEKLQEEVSTKKQNKPSKKTMALMINAAVILCFCAAVLIIPASREKTTGIFKGFIPNSSVDGGHIWEPSDFDIEEQPSDFSMEEQPSVDTEVGGEDGNTDYGASSDERTDSNNAADYNAGGLMSGAAGEQTTAAKSFELNLKYIPDGFSIDDSPLFGGWNDEEHSICKHYNNGDSRFEISKQTENISLEGVQYETVYIAGVNYMIIENDDYIHIFWSKNAAYYRLSGTNIERDELLKIAANAA